LLPAAPLPSPAAKVLGLAERELRALTSARLAASASTRALTAFTARALALTAARAAACAPLAACTAAAPSAPSPGVTLNCRQAALRSGEKSGEVSCPVARKPPLLLLLLLLLP
jgi:hypothetical protein